jgi:hypothetical protein
MIHLLGNFSLTHIVDNYRKNREKRTILMSKHKGLEQIIMPLGVQPEITEVMNEKKE